MPFTRYRAFWNGLTGGLGYSNFYLDGEVTTGADVDAYASAVKDFFLDVGLTRWPNELQFTFDSVVSHHDNNGEMYDETPVPNVPTAFTGTGSGGWAAPAGARVDWRTNAFFGGRRVIGSTYLVPLAAGVYQNDGTLLETTRTAIVDAATSLLDEAATLTRLVVWSRTHEAVVPIDVATVKDQVAVLRSRRS